MYILAYCSDWQNDSESWVYTRADLDLLFDLSEAILRHTDRVVARIDARHSECAGTISDILSDNLAARCSNDDVRAHNHCASSVLHASRQDRRVLTSRSSG